MNTFSMAFRITKPESPLLWWSRYSRALLCRFEEIPVAHTGFPIQIPEGFQKRNPVCFLRVSKYMNIPSQTVWDTRGLVLHSLKVPRWKTKQMDGADQTTFSFKAPVTPQWQKKGTPTVTLLPCNNTSIVSRSSHIAHKGALVEVAMGQRTGSVLGVICRKRTLWCCPVVRVKLPVPYVSLGPWDSLTKFNCSKGLHQQALSTPIRPGPLSVGKVFVAFVQMCRTQTAARQGQAADLYSRLCQSKAAQAQTQ